MTLKWIAERLAMGSWNNVSNRLAALRQKKTMMTQKSVKSENRLVY
jgi:hypothetical protein